MQSLKNYINRSISAWWKRWPSIKLRWQTSTTPDQSNVLGGPAPVISDQLAIFAFGNGEVQATFRQGGLRVWNAIVSGQRRFSALARVADITGDPSAIVDELRKIGRLAGLEADQLESCLQDREKAQTLVAWYQQNAEADGIDSTPSFVINGKKYSNMAYDEMRKLIDEAAQ